MIKMINKEWCNCTNEYRNTYILDSEDEFADLPACAPGSEAICPASAIIYMVNASGEWVKVGG